MVCLEGLWSSAASPTHSVREGPRREWVLGALWDSLALVGINFLGNSWVKSVSQITRPRKNTKFGAQRDLAKERSPFRAPSQAPPSPLIAGVSAGRRRANHGNRGEQLVQGSSVSSSGGRRPSAR